MNHHKKDIVVDDDGNDATVASTTMDVTTITATIASPPPPPLFDPIQLVQQLWKGFCIPNNDDADKTGGDLVHVDRHHGPKGRGDALMVQQDVPRCINVLEETTTTTTTTTTTDDELLVASSSSCHCGPVMINHHHGNLIIITQCEKENIDSDGILSNDDDSYDDNDDDDDRNIYFTKHEDNDGDGMMVHWNTEYVVETIPGTSRTVRVWKGLETFLYAVLLFVITLYILQQQQQQQNNNTNNNDMGRANDKIWGWHYKIAVPTSDSMIYCTFKK
jgi:hypothetical protein